MDRGRGGRPFGRRSLDAASHAITNDPAWLIPLGTNQSDPGSFVEGGNFKCAMAQLASDTYAGAWQFTTYEQVWLPYAVLTGMTVFFLIILMIVLKRRDSV